MDLFIRGTLIHIRVSFTVETVATDPTVVTYEMITPDGKSTAYIFGTDVALVKDSAGNYHVDFTPSMRGMHCYRFAGTGTCQAACEGQFLVPPSPFS